MMILRKATLQLVKMATNMLLTRKPLQHNGYDDASFLAPQNTSEQSPLCSSSPNRNCFAGLRSDFGCKPERTPILTTYYIQAAVISPQPLRLCVPSLGAVLKYKIFSSATELIRRPGRFFKSWYSLSLHLEEALPKILLHQRFSEHLQLIQTLLDCQLLPINLFYKNRKFIL